MASQMHLLVEVLVVGEIPPWMHLPTSDGSFTNSSTVIFWGFFGVCLVLAILRVQTNKFKEQP